MTTLYDTYNQKIHPLAIALAETQDRGVLIDLKAREDIRMKVTARIKETEEAIKAIAGAGLNPNSPKQVNELLYEKMKLPVIYKDNKPTTDEEAIKKLFQRYPGEPILKLILSYRKDTKLISTFIDVPVDEDNRMRTSYNPSGTDTFRISSSRNIFGKGMNLQNIPKGKRAGIENVRNLFIADPGKVLVKGDLVQAEAMVVAWILTRYGDKVLYEKYKAGKFDIHKWAAAPIFGVSEPGVTKWQREVGKIANHAGNYCAGPKVIQSTATKWDVYGVDYTLAKRIVDTRRSQLPGLERWWEDVERRIRSTRSITTCLGFRRQFFDRPESCVSVAVAFEPQCIVGTLCNQIFTRMWALNFEMLLQVHDEVVFQVPDNPEDIMKGILCLRSAARIPLAINQAVEPLIIPVEISVGKNWRDCEEVKE